MKTIWKFPLAVGGTGIPLPVDARILSVQNQNGVAVLWAELDDAQPMERRNFTTALTGGQAPPSPPWEYIGTVQLEGGSFVVHVYQAK